MPSIKRKRIPSNPYENKFSKMRKRMSGSMVRSLKSEASTAVPRSLSMRAPVGMPKKLLVTLRYNQAVTLADPLSGAVSTNLFRANSLYDPDYTGAGHQPLGFDQYMALYAQYLVRYSKITVTGINSSTGIVFGVSLLPTATSFGTSPEYIEQQTTGYSFSIPASPTINQAAITTFDAKRFFDVTDPKDEADLQGSIGSNPAKSAYYHVWAGAYSGSSDPTATIINVLIEYQVEFSQPLALNLS